MALERVVCKNFTGTSGEFRNQFHFVWSFSRLWKSKKPFFFIYLLLFLSTVFRFLEKGLRSALPGTDSAIRPLDDPE